MPACGYEFYLLVFNSISHSFAALTREISSWTLEDKIRIHARACDILYIHARACNILYIHARACNILYIHLIKRGIASQWIVKYFIFVPATFFSGSNMVNVQSYIILEKVNQRRKSSVSRDKILRRVSSVPPFWMSRRPWGRSKLGGVVRKKGGWVGGEGG